MILRLNDRGDAVKQLQTKLGLKADGHFGPITQQAVIRFQNFNALAPDGIAGPQTLAAMGLATPKPVLFVGGKKLVEADYVEAARQLSKPGRPCKVNAVKAVAKVESLGDAFLPDGRTKILYERHQFFKWIRDKVLRDKLTVSDRDLCHRSLKTGRRVDAQGKKIPEIDRYQGNEAEYGFLDRARVFDNWAALMSASYGMFQIMGFNHKAAGYATVEEFYEAMQCGGERAQLFAFISFIKAHPRMWDALLALDWAKFAENYNGPGYAANKYDTKMADAFKAFGS